MNPRAILSPGEVVTLAVLFAIKGVGQRAFYRRLDGNWRHLFPHLPERTRLFRLFTTHRGWTRRLLAQPTFFGVADAYGVELVHPVRQGRSKQQIGRKGLSNRRWIVGGKLGFVGTPCMASSMRQYNPMMWSSMTMGLFLAEGSQLQHGQALFAMSTR